MQESPYIENNSKVIELIRKIDRFAGFSEEHIESFLKMARLQDYAPGETIIKEGEYDTFIYLLLKGSLEINKNGKRVGTIVRNGDVFGEMGFIDGAPRSASIIALERSLIMSVDGKSLEKIADPGNLLFHCLIYRVFLEVLAGRLRETTEENVQLVKENTNLKESLVADV